MKALILVLFSFTCFAQQPAVMDPVLVQDLDFTLVRPEFGKVYRVMLRKDHAILAEGIADSTWVTICYGCQITNTPPPAAQVDTVDFSPAAITYSANWARKGEPPFRSGWYKGTISYSTAGTASHKFNGKRIEIWGERGATGSAAVVIDGQSYTVSWNGQFGLPVMIFAKDIPAGDHEITIAPKGDGNVLIDFLLIHR